MVVRLWLMVALTVAQHGCWTADRDNWVAPPETELLNTQLVKAYVIFRHGDRTPDQDEISVYPNAALDASYFFPYGIKALTNTGKLRSYRVGEFLRRRYGGFLSRLYIADEVRVRCTDFDRTKMSALTAMAALYPPERLQTWNPNLAWQPVPYDIEPKETCNLLYWYNCPAYHELRHQVYTRPEIDDVIKENADLFATLSDYTGSDISMPHDVFYLDNLFQTLENVGLAPPDWSIGLMPRIKNMTKVEYQTELTDDRMVSLAFGPTLGEILLDAERAVKGISILPKLHVYSAHENNVAAMMAACKVFQPHQPGYGATFALELRRINSTGKYAFVAVHSPQAGGPAHLLPISGCGGRVLCDYDQFLWLTSNLVLTQEEFRGMCNS